MYKGEDGPSAVENGGKSCNNNYKNSQFVKKRTWAAELICYCFLTNLGI